jgi:hypothetical protein
MSFMDEVSGGGGAKLLKFDGKAGNYVVRGSDANFNNQEFVADIYAAKGGYIKFGEKGARARAPAGKYLSQRRGAAALLAWQPRQERMAARQVRRRT